MTELTCRECGAVLEAETRGDRTEVVVDHYAEAHGFGDDET